MPGLNYSSDSSFATSVKCRNTIADFLRVPIFRKGLVPVTRWQDWDPQFTLLAAGLTPSTHATFLRSSNLAPGSRYHLHLTSRLHIRRLLTRCHRSPRTRWQWSQL